MTCLMTGSRSGPVALEQLLAATAVQGEIELPGKIPDVVQSGVHALPAERTVDVRCITRDEDPSDLEPRDMPMMDAEIAAPVERERLDLCRCALPKYPLHEIERRSVAFCLLDRRDDPPPGGRHRKDRGGPEFAGTQQQLIRRKRFVGLDVRQQKRILVLHPFEGQVQ